jgi:hypothetical protein
LALQHQTRTILAGEPQILLPSFLKAGIWFAPHPENFETKVKEDHIANCLSEFAIIFLLI